ncbi:MADS-box domain-containing protein [Psidium guajava]|nr:MADS-box domain-containing protein [Psidium guajava]
MVRVFGSLNGVRAERGFFLDRSRWSPSPSLRDGLFSNALVYCDEWDSPSNMLEMDGKGLGVSSCYH